MNAQKKEEAKTQEPRGQIRTREGVVVSNKMNKTVVVSITRQVRHEKYGKIIKRWNKLYAHDEQNACKVGDTVEVIETRPLSRLKRWRVIKVLSHAAA